MRLSMKLAQRRKGVLILRFISIETYAVSSTWSAWCNTINDIRTALPVSSAPCLGYSTGYVWWKKQYQKLQWDQNPVATV